MLPERGVRSTKSGRYKEPAEADDGRGLGEDACVSGALGRGGLESRRLLWASSHCSKLWL
jgi:hypothetical protein